MQVPGIPDNEEQRLKSLCITGLLDTRDDERFERLTRLAQRAFQVPIALISLLDRERQWLLACQGIGVRETPRNISFCGHAILQEGPFIIHDAAADERFRDNPLVIGEPHIRFYAGQPVSLQDGTVAGTLCLIHTSPRDFSDEDIASLRDLASIVEDEFHAISMAMTDSLTGIPNRRGFYHAGEKLFRAMNWQNASFSLIYFDLDKFKPVNDLWGHAEGDEVLRVFSGFLHQHLEPGEIAGRLGGDEFAALIRRNGSTRSFLHALRASLAHYNDTSGKPYNINYSFGELINNVNLYATLEEMIGKCDELMYLKKKRKTLSRKKEP
ncbi:GGDEF domain-containing protein [Klebsiella aerogenes]|uniref:GGDEF domain-containing protein n=1 Tax=Klebsiella aerogenes TaxID=548 RepID=UPI001908C53C|nr:sensor domain-containing diguanylate cyclase [Klebsiella aerogenes]MBK0469802.1 sensor domain-containing diguanylate cyclase [Klebsiella aerogenes]HBU8525004.1 sensor domain-containing diguanylate cyclase [Klebsiella aerogenes]